MTLHLRPGCWQKVVEQNQELTMKTEGQVDTSPDLVSASSCHAIEFTGTISTRCSRTDSISSPYPYHSERSSFNVSQNIISLEDFFINKFTNQKTAFVKLYILIFIEKISLLPRVWV